MTLFEKWLRQTQVPCEQMTSVWFSPAPSETTDSRISLDFGLRAADLFFRELVVPELGRMWFVRQISWAVAALALHEELRSSRSRPPKPTAICHGIEALACKLEYTPDRDNRSTRILGTRAFGRDPTGRDWFDVKRGDDVPLKDDEKTAKFGRSTGCAKQKTTCATHTARLQRARSERSERIERAVGSASRAARASISSS
jgi:hypothetical protein